MKAVLLWPSVLNQATQMSWSCVLFDLVRKNVGREKGFVHLTPISSII